jgi:hypothetical protein
MRSIIRFMVAWSICAGEPDTDFGDENWPRVYV